MRHASSNGGYSPDDVTIDNWMPSLPRPKIKPGVVAHDDIEMHENRLPYAAQVRVAL